MNSRARFFRAELILALPISFGGDNRSNHRTAGANDGSALSDLRSHLSVSSERKIPTGPPPAAGRIDP